MLDAVNSFPVRFLPSRISSACLAHPDHLKVQNSSPVCGQSFQATVRGRLISLANLDILVVCSNVHSD